MIFNQVPFALAEQKMKVKQKFPLKREKNRIWGTSISLKCARHSQYMYETDNEIERKQFSLSTSQI